MWWMAMASLPLPSVTTTGRLTTVSVDRIATLGTLMIGADMNDPNGPGLVIVKVEPARSSGSILPLRAFSARRRTSRAMPRSRSPSVPRTVITTRPSSLRSTPYPRFTVPCIVRTLFSRSKLELTTGKAISASTVARLMNGR